MLSLVGLAACDGADGGDDVDPDLVDALVELHLADARAALDTVEARRPALAESLRRVALKAHGLDSAAFETRLDALAGAPALAEATYDSVETRLVRERQGSPAPRPDSLKAPPAPGF
ncbi:hypothetical protein BSZ37_09255 [Rubrivirga marina]|uniref:DUF4296 domain-containing protein n=2 Tax=Rubrivirga marina TaxID=1196024 RepID=A0A271J0Y2_9BACT|nr:hypothetical protein BSZ37_09255 [Rubrivirga marina]